MAEKYHVKVRFIEPLLGTSPANTELHSEFIASKAPDALKRDEEIAIIGADEAIEKSMTIFPKQDGVPFTWDYQWKGFFKDACNMLRRAEDSVSKMLKAYKKEIDGLVFVTPRRIPLVLPEGGEITECQRPLRASTPQGERIALAHSEQVPEGTEQEFDIVLLNDNLVKFIKEWLDYGIFRGTGQWRNSGAGRFVYEMTDADGNIIGSTM